MPDWDEAKVPYEKPGPPKGEAYGIASVTQALKGLDFPASKEDLLKRAGNESIEWTKGHPMKLRDILKDSQAEEYPSMAQVVSAISDVMDRRNQEQKAA